MMFRERLAPNVSPARASFLLPMSQSLLPRVVSALLALSYLGTLANAVSASVNNADVRSRAEGSRFVYEARVGLLVAGELDLERYSDEIMLATLESPRRSCVWTSSRCQYGSVASMNRL